MLKVWFTVAFGKAQVQRWRVRGGSQTWLYGFQEISATKTASLECLVTAQVNGEVVKVSHWLNGNE